jgi:hypothetical protein
MISGIGRCLRTPNSWRIKSRTYVQREAGAVGRNRTKMGRRCEELIHNRVSHHIVDFDAGRRLRLPRRATLDAMSPESLPDRVRA